jgi:hypothetical protein
MKEVAFVCSVEIIYLEVVVVVTVVPIDVIRFIVISWTQIVSIISALITLEIVASLIISDHVAKNATLADGVTMVSIKLRLLDFANVSAGVFCVDQHAATLGR